MKVVVIDSGKNTTLLKSIVGSPSVETVGVIIEQPGKEVSSTHQKYLSEKNIPIITFSDLEYLNPDIIIVVTWGKTIPDEYVTKHNIINIHGGILPKWRGLSSNIWAIINGEKEVGYTVQKLDSELDGGDIYKVYSTIISDDELFGDARMRIHDLLCADIEYLLRDIYSGNITPISQKGEKFVYNTLLNPNDGIICWRNTTDYIFGIYQTMAKPYGSGVYFNYEGQTYEVTKMSKDTNYSDYAGIPGAVVYINRDRCSIVVKTLDNVVVLNEVKKEGEVIDLTSEFRIGLRLPIYNP